MSSDFNVHATRVESGGAPPSRWMLVLHGILGSGGNFRSVARRLTLACPAWGFVLVDLRGHGRSLDPPAPQTIAAAAEDLVRLGRSLALPISGVMGHSFGGKVAMAYAGMRRGELDQAWILDAGPSARPDGEGSVMTGAVLQMLEQMPAPLPSRERFFEIVGERGFERGIAEWLAMNLQRAEDGYRLRVDLRTIRALLEDYFKQDLWPTLEAPRHLAAREVHVVLGGRSLSVPEADKARYRELAERSLGAVSVHELPSAGHWVHADDPEGLISLVTNALCR